MVEIAAIFEEIRKRFSSLFPEQDQYSFYFTPLSLGFHESDFLFLDTDAASDQALKYYDELLEFSTITNNIPKQGGIWEIDENKGNALSSRYMRVVSGAQWVDPDSITTEAVIGTPLFGKALLALQDPRVQQYKAYYDLIQQDLQRILDLKQQEQTAATQIELDALNGKVALLQADWVSKGFKQEIEAIILDSIQRDIVRFQQEWKEVKQQIESTLAKLTHAATQETFLPVFCTPSNLYKSADLPWVKIELDRAQILSLIQNLNPNTYAGIIDNDDANKLQFESISFELLFVTLTRNWFNESMLLKPYWNLDPLAMEGALFQEYPVKMVLLRRVNQKPLQNSAINAQIISRLNTIQLAKIGSFLIDTKQLTQLKVLPLQPVPVNRNIHRNLNEMIRSKSYLNKNIHRRFNEAKEGTKPDSNVEEKIDIQPLVTNTRILPGITKLNALNTNVLSKMSFQLQFTDSQGKQIAGIIQNVLIEDKVLTLEDYSVSNGVHAFSAPKSTTYEVVFLNAQNVEHQYTIQANIQELKLRAIKRSIEVKPPSIPADQVEEVISMVAVICKKLPQFPAPLKNCTYI